MSSERNSRSDRPRSNSYESLDAVHSPGGPPMSTDLMFSGGDARFLRGMAIGHSVAMDWPCEFWLTDKEIRDDDQDDRKP
jgi:hypothetical protein